MNFHQKHSFIFTVHTSGKMIAHWPNSIDNQIFMLFSLYGSLIFKFSEKLQSMLQAFKTTNKIQNSIKKHDAGINMIFCWNHFPRFWMAHICNLGILSSQEKIMLLFTCIYIKLLLLVFIFVKKKISKPTNKMKLRLSLTEKVLDTFQFNNGKIFLCL